MGMTFSTHFSSSSIQFEQQAPINQHVESRRHVHRLLHAIELVAVAVRHAVVKFAVGDERRGLEVLRIEHRIFPLQAVDVIPWLAAHDLGKTLRHVGGIQGVGTVHAGVIDGDLEAVGVGTGRATILDGFRSAEGSNGRLGSFPRS